MYSISKISSIINAPLLQLKEDALIDQLLTDSRKVLFPASTLFFAMGNASREGSQFIDELYRKGVRNFVVDENFISAINYPAANFLKSANVLSALQLLAGYHRRQFSIPVIGITGSNGKTMVKEWLYQLLQYDYNIVRSPKSYNSQIGVPLSVWQINAANTLGIFEAGISQPGEMEKLQQIIQPTIAVFTNIGEAHSEGFENNEQKIKEKNKLFSGAEVLIFNKDMPGMFVSNPSAELFTWSKKQDATVLIKNICRQHDQTDIDFIYKEKEQRISIPFTDEASIENTITCLCVMLYLKINEKVIKARMLKLQPVEMRLQLKQGINNCSVINDSYSADINSFIIALDFLLQQQQHSKRTVILSDIIGSGQPSNELYARVGNILHQKNIDRLIAVGNEISGQHAAFKQIPETHFFASTDALIKNFHTLHFSNETILVKGARIFGLETLIHLLEQKVHQTFLEINLSSITHNLKYYQQQLKPGTKMMAMVKASGYGSGSFEIANLLQFHKVDYLAVAYVDEGIELRKAGIRLPIMVMNAEPATFDMLLQHNLEPEIYSFGILQALENYLQQSGITQYPVHIKLDTGMHRLGFEAADIPALSEKLKQQRHFKIQTVFSHLAASDDPSEDDFTRMQANVFLQCCDQLRRSLGYDFIKHIANTSAINRHKELQLDMVRLGIGLYGVDSNAAVQSQLKNVATLRTTISQIKKVNAGETVGYSRKAVVKKDSMIATVRIGYADGYPRVLSNGNGEMMIKGVPAKVIGNVCMDMTMLDITGINAEEGDEVIVFGTDLIVSTVAKEAGTIAYEILTGISQRVQRVYYEE
ncbi:MAG: bifunctional UDP-N-acetylmuramoyl-tripeptide:D-alanyl-D-alanine ligase/alanine racemase [Ferruginibacter sp.]